MNELQKIFQENAKIHDKIIQEQEEKRIKHWLSRMEKCCTIEEILTTLYMAAGNETNRTIKTLITAAKDRNKSIQKSRNQLMNGIYF